MGQLRGEAPSIAGGKGEASPGNAGGFKNVKRFHLPPSPPVTDPLRQTAIPGVPNLSGGGPDVSNFSGKIFRIFENFRLGRAGS